MTVVGVVGLGQMGAALTGAVLDAGLSTYVHDIRPEAAEPLMARGATFATSIAELAGAVDLVAVVVLDDQQVRDVVAAIDSAPKRRAEAVAVHSTVAPETLIELAASSAVEIIDAPVSGGPGGAQRGELAVMVGSTAEAFEAARPYLDTIGGHVVRVGDVGDGTRMKLARNLITYSAWLAAYEGQLLAEACGLDLKQLAGIVRYSEQRFGGAAALMLRDTVAPLPEGFDAGWVEMMGNTARLAHKDLSAALAVAGRLGVDLPVTALADDRFDRVVGIDPRPDDRSDP